MRAKGCTYKGGWAKRGEEGRSGLLLHVNTELLSRISLRTLQLKHYTHARIQSDGGVWFVWLDSVCVCVHAKQSLRWLDAMSASPLTCTTCATRA